MSSQAGNPQIAAIIEVFGGGSLLMGVFMGIFQVRSQLDRFMREVAHMGSN